MCLSTKILPNESTLTTFSKCPDINPQATLIGLPVELRAQIYTHVLRGTLVHIHCRSSDGNGPPTIIWRQCIKPDPRTTLLCANPKWSGACLERDRCDYNPSTTTDVPNTLPIQLTCKAFYMEMSSMVSTEIAVSLPQNHFLTFIKHTPKHVTKNLRRLTVTGNYRGYVNSTPPRTHLTLRDFLEALPEALPQLEEIAFQKQAPRSVMCTIEQSPEYPRGQNVIRPQKTLYRWRRLSFCLSVLNPTTTVVMDETSWFKSGDAVDVMEGEGEMVRFTLLRHGKEGCVAREDDMWSGQDVECWTERNMIRETAESANWRSWWAVNRNNWERGLTSYAGIEE